MRKHGIDRQWATATSTVKSNYFRFATITLNFMRSMLSHTVDTHTIGFIMRGSYKIAIYTVPLSTVNGEILLLPVRVRHVENSRTWLPTRVYTLLRRIIFEAYKLYSSNIISGLGLRDGVACRRD